MAAYKGQPVRIRVSGDYVEGEIHLIDFSSRRLTLNRVVCITSDGTRSSMPGMHTYFGDELNALQFLGEKKKKKKTKLTATGMIVGEEEREEDDDDDDDSGGYIRLNSRPPRHVSRLHDLDNKDLLLGKADHQLTVLETLKRPVVQVPGRPSSYVIVDQIDEKFDMAREHIAEHSIIGVSALGVNIGRSGQLCWLAVATKEQVFLFDVLKLGKDCFDQGLGKILEHENIMKVFHDCRRVSDMLFHQYGVRLVNVFDTQVADVLIFRNENGGDLPKYVHTLPYCLIEHLHISPEEVHFERSRQQCIEEDEKVWASRPARDVVLDAASKTALYLRELRKAMQQRLLAELVDGTDIYLGTQRDASDAFLKRNTPSQAHLPREFKRLTNNWRGRDYDRSPDWLKRDEDGFVERRRHIVRDPVMSMSQSGIWHAHKIGTPTMIQQDPKDKEYFNQMKPSSSSSPARQSSDAVQPNTDAASKGQERVQVSQPLLRNGQLQSGLKISPNVIIPQRVREKLQASGVGTAEKGLCNKPSSTAGGTDASVCASDSSRLVTQEQRSHRVAHDSWSHPVMREGGSAQDIAYKLTHGAYSVIPDRSQDEPPEYYKDDDSSSSDGEKRYFSPNNDLFKLSLRPAGHQQDHSKRHVKTKPFNSAPLNLDVSHKTTPSGSAFGSCGEDSEDIPPSSDCDDFFGVIPSHNALLEQRAKNS